MKKIIIFFIITWLVFSCNEKLSQVNSDIHKFGNSSTNTKKNIISQELIKILRGNFQPSQKKKLFTKISSKYSIRKNMYLQKETMKAFRKMVRSAKKEKNINLYILSATRNFTTQKYIWEAKFLGRRKVGGQKLNQTIPDYRSRGLKILRFSSMPGTSRHHWGTDLDIAFSIGTKSVWKNLSKMLNNKTYKSGDGLIVYNWLHSHAHKFGFCQPYQNTPLNRNPSYQKGYQEERWHWSYKPTAKNYTKLFEQHSDKLYPRDFKGSKVGREYYLSFVLNIHPDCMK